MNSSPVSLKDFLAYLWVYWFLADSQGGPEETEATPVIEALCIGGTTMQVLGGRTRPIAYEPAEARLRIHPHSKRFQEEVSVRLECELDLIRAKRLVFEPLRSFENRLQGFPKTDDYRRWRDGSLNPIERMKRESAKRYEIFRKIAPGLRSLPFRGLLQTSRQAGEVSIAISDKATIAQAALETHGEKIVEGPNLDRPLPVARASEIGRLWTLLTGHLTQPPPSEAVPHPVVGAARIQERFHLQIAGEYGAGKTIALYQLAVRLPGDTLVVVISPTATADLLLEPDRILSSLAPDGPVRLAILVDDLHQHPRQPSVIDVLRGFGARLQRANPAAEFRLVISFLSFQRRLMHQLHPVLADSRIFDAELRLDDPPGSFLEAVAEWTRGGPISYEERQSLLESLGVERTPRTMVRQLLGDTVNSADRNEDRERRRGFRALVHAPERAVLRTVSALELSGWDLAIPITLAERCCMNVFETTRSEFHDAIPGLVQDRWIRVDWLLERCSVWSAETVGLLANGEPTELLKRFIEWVLTAKDYLRNTQIERLTGLVKSLLAFPGSYNDLAQLFHELLERGERCAPEFRRFVVLFGEREGPWALRSRAKTLGLRRLLADLTSGGDAVERSVLAKRLEAFKEARTGRRDKDLIENAIRELTQER